MMSSFTREQRTTIIAFFSLCAATLCAFVYKSTIEAVSSSFILDLGGSMTDAGIQGSAFFIAAVAMRFVSGPIADTCGNRPVMLVGLIALATGGFVLAFCTELWQVVFARCIQAVGLAAFYPSATSAVSMLAPPGKTGTYLGVYRIFAVLPMAFGPALFLSVARTGGFGLCFGILGCVALAGFILVAFTLPTEQPAARRSASCSFAERVKDIHLVGSVKQVFLSSSHGFVTLLVLAFLSSVGFVVTSSFTIVYAEAHGVPANFGAFFVLFSIGGLVSNPLAGWLSDKMGTMSLIVVSFAIMGFGLAALAGSALQPILLYVAGLLVGFGKSGTTICILSAVTQKVNEQHRTLAISLQQSCSDLGGAFATGALGVLFDATEFSPVILFAVALVVVLAGCWSYPLLKEKTPLSSTEA